MAPDCETIICSAMLELADRGKKLYAEKAAALVKLLAICRAYQQEGFMPEIVIAICQKKSGFLLNATKITEIREILKPATVRYNGCEVVSNGEFSVPEEELIIWSRTSLQAPLNSYGFDRYIKLFRQVFPDKADAVFGDKHGRVDNL